MNLSKTGLSVLLLAGACISALFAVSCRSTNEGASRTLPSPTTATSEQPSQTIAERSRAANEWIREPPANSKAGSANTLDNSRWRIVLDSKEPSAESMLQTAPFLSLTQSQAFELAGKFSLQATKTAKPFLIRAVGSHMETSGFEIYAEKNGDVTVIGGALSHHDVPPERRPIVVWLDQPPRRLYIAFDVAE
jgi:hypothetical protein